MKRLHQLLIGFFLVSNVANAGFHVGGQINVIDFFIIPGGASGLSASSKFGIGSIYGGYSLGKVAALRAFLSYDNTGTLTGTGQLFGQTATFSGSFKVFTFGGELFIDPPVFPLYFRLGIGVGSLNASELPSPYDNLGMKFAINLGIGISFDVGDSFKIHAGLDGVYLALDAGNTGLTDVSGFPYFKAVAGVTYYL